MVPSSSSRPAINLEALLLTMSEWPCSAETESVERNIAPSIVRHGSRVPLQFSPIRNKRHTNLWDRRFVSRTSVTRRLAQVGAKDAARELTGNTTWTSKSRFAHQMSKMTRINQSEATDWIISDLSEEEAMARRSA
jgi:hypothetical protein